MGLWDLLSDPIEESVLNTSDRAANIDAINQYIAGTQPMNAEARQIQDDWLIWYADLGWYSKSVDEDSEKKAINMRNAFMRANASFLEKGKVDDFLSNTPIINPVTGKPTGANAAGNRPVPKEPLIPTMYKLAGTITATAVLVLVGLKKLRIL